MAAQRPGCIASVLELVNPGLHQVTVQALHRNVRQCAPLHRRLVRGEHALAGGWLNATAIPAWGWLCFAVVEVYEVDKGKSDLRCVGDVCSPESQSAPEGYALLPSGSFTMGSPPGEAGRYGNEVKHTVVLTRAFYLKTTEVTQGEWTALMGNNPAHFSSCGEHCPVETVSWYDSLAYCNVLSKSESLSECYDLSSCTGTPGSGDYTCPDHLTFSLNCEGYRLPTAAEWEYASRAGGDHLYADRQALYSGVNWYNWEEPDLGNNPVGLGRANEWGLHDMRGNVWEWTWDWYSEDYMDAHGLCGTPDASYLGSGRLGANGHDHLPRGAKYDWRFPRGQVWVAPVILYQYTGLRLARSVR